MGPLAPILASPIGKIGLSILGNVVASKVFGKKEKKTAAPSGVADNAVADQAAATQAQQQKAAAQKAAIFKKSQTGGQKLLLSPGPNSYLGIPNAPPKKNLGGPQ